MKLYDCFIFNDELELLELRLMETYDLVDKFVLVESPHSFMCNPKPLTYSANKGRFDEWNDKIIHVVADDIEIAAHPVVERAQRECISRGLTDAEPEDVIIVSDVDEIISRRALHGLRKHPPLRLAALVQFLYYYRVNCLQSQMWFGPTARLYGSGDVSAQSWRDDRNRVDSIPLGGWHFSWLGDVARLQSKLQSIDVSRDSNGKMVPPDVDDVKFIQNCIDTGADLFGRTDDYTRKRTVGIEPGTMHPKCINEWLEKYPVFAT